MRNLLRKLLGIHTLKLMLINPAIDFEQVKDLDIPVFFVLTNLVDDIKFIDTGIPMELIKDESASHKARWIFKKPL